MRLRAMEAIRRWEMLPQGTRVVAAVSGGADSTALLHFLCSLRQNTEFAPTVYALHVNHGLRGAEAQRDEEFCAALCEKLGVRLFVRRFDVRDEAKRRGMTVEEAGRAVRYGCFEELGAQLDARVATAHTQSDSVETALLNFTRGTGLRGLCGIPPVRGRIVRPLILDTRADTEAYCAESGLSFVTDSTNLERAYTRNRLRLDVLPVLQGINPSFPKTAGRCLEALREDDAFLTQLAHEKLCQAQADDMAWNCGALAALPPALRSRALMQAARLAGCPQPDARHLLALEALISSKVGRLQLAGGWFAVAARGVLSFENAAAERQTPAACPASPLAPGVLNSGPYTFRISECGAEELKNYFNFIHKEYLNFAIDCDKIKGIAVVRARGQGDFLRPVGRGVAKTLKKWYNETGVPVEDRPSLPVAADENGVLWAFGLGADERCAAGRNTRRALVFEALSGPGARRPATETLPETWAGSF